MEGTKAKEVKGPRGKKKEKLPHGQRGGEGEMASHVKHSISETQS